MSVAEKVLDVADDVMVRLITKGSEKQDRVNALLADKNANVRIASFEVQMGTPPTIVYAIERISEK